MISAYYMREMQKENEKRIERANKIRRYYSRDKESKPDKPGIISRLLHDAGSALINFGTAGYVFPLTGSSKDKYREQRLCIRFDPYKTAKGKRQNE